MCPIIRRHPFHQLYSSLTGASISTHLSILIKFVPLLTLNLFINIFLAFFSSYKSTFVFTPLLVPSDYSAFLYILLQLSIMFELQFTDLAVLILMNRCCCHYMTSIVRHKYAIFICNRFSTLSMEISFFIFVVIPYSVDALSFLRFGRDWITVSPCVCHTAAEWSEDTPPNYGAYPYLFPLWIVRWPFVSIGTLTKTADNRIHKDFFFLVCKKKKCATLYVF